MKIPWETILPALFIAVASGITVWLAKLILNALVDSICRKLKERVDKLESRVDNAEKQIEKNEEDIDYWIKTMIDRNS